MVELAVDFGQLELTLAVDERRAAVQQAAVLHIGVDLVQQPKVHAGQQQGLRFGRGHAPLQLPDPLLGGRGPAGFAVEGGEGFVLDLTDTLPKVADVPRSRPPLDEVLQHPAPLIGTRVGISPQCLGVHGGRGVEAML
mgnify:CR=1 FL=1